MKCILMQNLRTLRQICTPKHICTTVKCTLQYTHTVSQRDRHEGRHRQTQDTDRYTQYVQADTNRSRYTATQRHTDTQTHRHTDTQQHRQTDTQTNRIVQTYTILSEDMPNAIKLVGFLNLWVLNAQSPTKKCLFCVKTQKLLETTNRCHRIIQICTLQKCTMQQTIHVCMYTQMWYKHTSTSLIYLYIHRCSSMNIHDTITKIVMLLLQRVRMSVHA